MTQLDISDGFDVHEYRHGLKLLKDDRETMTLSNRKGFTCPACGKAFDTLLVSKKRTNTLGNPGAPFCLARTDDQLLVLTH